MNFQEAIDSKVGAIFEVADRYLANELSLEESKDLIYNEMSNIRPAQFDQFKLELGTRIKKLDHPVEIERLYEIFGNYLPFPYKKLEEGHPIRNYYQENNIVRQYLISMDKMEGENKSLDDWKNVYELLNEYQIHIQRLSENLYPYLLSKGMHQQIEKLQESGILIGNEIIKNQDLLGDNQFFDFLLNQKKLALIFMKHLDLEERLIFPSALKLMTEEELLKLRELDDQEGYAYIERPVSFTPQKNNKVFTIQDNHSFNFLLPQLLTAKQMSIVYYNPLGEVVYFTGKQLKDEDFRISDRMKEELLKGKEEKKGWYKQGLQYFLITYSLVRDGKNKIQGILKTKEAVGPMSELMEAHKEREKHSNSVMARAGGSSREKDIDLKANQNVGELLDRYPKLGGDFFNLDEELEGLRGPMGVELIRKSTVEMLAKSLRMDTTEFMGRITKLLESYSV